LDKASGIIMRWINAQLVVLFTVGMTSVALGQQRGAFDEMDQHAAPAPKPNAPGQCRLNGDAPSSPNSAAVSIVFDTSASMLDQGRGEEARRVLQLFGRTASSRLDVALTTFQGACGAVVPHPLAPMTDDARRHFSTIVAKSPFASATPIIESVRLAAAQLDHSAAKQKIVLLVTDGDPTCVPNERQQLCGAFSVLQQRGIQVVVLGYLLTPEMATAYNSCPNSMTYYGINEKTPTDQAGRLLMRYLFRARRQFLTRTSDNYMKSLYSTLDNTQCIDSHMPSRWNLYGQSELHVVGGRNDRTEKDQTVEVHTHHLLQPQVETKEGIAEVGAEDLFVQEGARVVSYPERLLEVMDACCGSGVAPKTEQQMNHFEDDFGNLDAIRKKAAASPPKAP
jgi:Mg-chelatase subunit ChlD